MVFRFNKKDKKSKKRKFKVRKAPTLKFVKRKFNRRKVVGGIGESFSDAFGKAEDLENQFNI